MAKLEIGADMEAYEGKLEKLGNELRRGAVRRMLGAGAGILETAERNEILARHRRTGAMADSMKRTEIREGLEGSYLYVYAQGEDSRGVRNEMKNTIINTGYWQRRGRRNVKKDPFVARVQKRSEPAVRKAMEDELGKCMDDAGLT